MLHGVSCMHDDTVIRSTMMIYTVVQVNHVDGCSFLDPAMLVMQFIMHVHTQLVEPA